MLHEVWQCAKFPRKDEVKQGPQLLQIVLDGGSRQNDPMRSSELQTISQIVNVL